MQHATDKMEQPPCSMQTQHATQPTVQRTACSMQHALLGVRAAGERRERAGEEFRADRNTRAGRTEGWGGGTAGLEELAGVCECAAIRRSGRCNALNMGR